MLTKLTKLLGLVFVFIAYSGNAQKYSVQGKVVSDEQKALIYANVFLLKNTDSTLVKAVSSNEHGAFEFTQIEPGNYILKSSYVGYTDYAQPLVIANSVQGLQLLLTKNVQELEGVVVNQPTIERKSDRLVFNVENTSLSELSSYDILKQTPGVIVTNGSILVKNSSAEVYINDRPVYLTGSELNSLLTNYSGSNIKSVEVITNPSAKYDAEASTIINITTAKSISIGYKGSVEGRWTQAVFPKYTLGTSHYYKNDFVNAFLNYSYNPKKQYKHDNSYVNWFDGNTPNGQWESDFRKVTRSYAHQLSTILDFTLGAKSDISLSSNILHSPNTKLANDIRTDVYDANEQLASYFNTDSDLDNDRSNVSVTLDYELKIGEKGATMNLVSDYIYYKDAQNQFLETNYYAVDNTFTGTDSFDFYAEQKNDIYTQGLDFSIPSEASSFETGVKYSAIKSNSLVNYSGDVVPLNTVDDQFKYTENVYAGYAQFNKEWEKWSLSTGLRGEYTDVEANSIALGDINTQKYFELFPTSIITYVPSENHQYSMSYKRSLERPKYGSLNPYRYYYNEDQYIGGNPSLTRAIENKIALDYTYKGQFIFSLYYQHVNNNLSKLVFQENENQILYESYYNIDHEFQYSLDFTYYGYVNSWWYLYTYMSGFYLENEFVALESGGVREQNHTMGYLGQAYNQFSLAKDGTLNANMTLYYLSNFIQGSYHFKNQFYVDLGLTKSLWNKRATVSLNIADIFNTNQVWIRSQYLNQDNAYKSMAENRNITLGFKYKFGNFRLADNNRETKSEEQERLEEKPVM
ncbi:outer membrane beta-barrel family protein [Zhouia amylolytica]|uniref:outer membrane beta-barrel family protein n=1 Tax=Zhouia amylolytica TaxID=376730 RepID=UPI0020CFA92B|nr:outer membrane beta-barrel family protein [Zhouia amylolytica]MCQ0112957.1 TonB-dependent receptor [Zhouia amylolytica]